MRLDGIVILDDCNPPNAERGSETPIGGAWNGDVWKLLAFLLAERPDLRVATLDADEGSASSPGSAGSPSVDEVIDVVAATSACPTSTSLDRMRVLNLVPPSRFDSLLP